MEQEPANINRPPLLPFIYAQAALLLAVVTISWLMLLRDGDSPRVGIDVISLGRTADQLVVIALIVGLAFQATGFLVWRDWRKRSPNRDVASRRACLALLIFALVCWVYVLLVLCVPSIFFDVVRS